MIDMRTPRPDVAFLRRRLKPGEQAAVADSAPAGSFLNLSQSPQAPASASAEQFLVASSPVALGVTELTPANPAASLTRRASAIGSLRITGADQAWWQGVDLTSGSLSPSGRSGAEIPERSNRPVLEFHGGELIVGLRHHRLLRRVVVASSTGHLTVHTATGVRATLPDGAALHLAPVNGMLELRAEIVSGDIGDAFGFTPDSTNEF
ncbi:hypothetical protein ACFVAJ_18365 [Agromyces sp. NPDC057679]|uniref:hypothetical protein n=1 Tax=Agromyces sp. NPDC057679 TaxID=3346207 RepID=UPI00366CA746